MFDKLRLLTAVQFEPEQDYTKTQLGALAGAYDMLHSSLTPTQRTGFLDWIFNVILPYVHTYHGTDNAYCLQDPSGQSNCSPSGSSYEPTHNLCVTSLYGEYIMGLACVGDDERCDNLVTYDHDWYRASPGIKSTLDIAYEGCHPFSGSNYGRNRYMPFLLEIADAESTALGLSSWMRWMDACPAFFIHSALPEFIATGCRYRGNTCSYFDPEYYPGQITWNDGRDLRAFLFSLDRNRATLSSRMAQYWLKHNHTPAVLYADVGYITATAHNAGKEYLPEWHLRYDQNAPEVDYGMSSTAYLAKGASKVFSRESWGQGDHFWMSQDASSLYGDHQTTGCGSFRMFKNGEFGIVENDTRYSGGNSNNTAHAGVLENILFMGNGAITGGYVTGGFARYSGLPASGVPVYTCSIPWLSQGPTYATWQDNLDAAYVVGDYPMTYVRRNFVHFKPITLGVATGAVNYVVILDVVAPQNAIAVKQQFFVPKDDPIVSVSDVISTLTNTRTMIHRIYPEAGMLTINDVTDGSVPQGSFGAECLQCGDGMSRIDNPSSAGTYHLLGVVISMQGTTDTLAPTFAIRGDSDDFVGALIDDPNVARVFLVRKDNTVKSATTFTFDAIPMTAAEYVICGLTPGTRYTHTFSSPTHSMTAGSGPVAVDANGCARFMDFTVGGSPAGRIPGNGSPEPPLRVAEAAGGSIVLDWSASCLATDNDYEVYEGVVGNWTSHAPRFCTTGGALTTTFVPADGDTYYLVVPRNAMREGSYGVDSNGTERPASMAACVTQEIDSCP